jgi:hypothetical protein
LVASRIREVHGSGTHKMAHLRCIQTKGGMHLEVIYLSITPTHAKFFHYYYFTPYTISAFKMPFSGGHSVKIIDYVQNFTHIDVTIYTIDV